MTHALALDTSSDDLTLALMKDGQVAASLQQPMGRQINARILDEIHRLLTQEGLTPRQLDLIGVSVGPGSFTGTRVGMALALTFGQVLNKPVIGIDTLRVMAAQTTPRAEPFLCVLHCSRDEVFMARYQWGPTGYPQRLDDISMALLEEFPGRAQSLPLVWRSLTPRWGEDVPPQLAGLERLPLTHPRGPRLLALALEDRQNTPGPFPPPVPLYIKSEAFRQWKP
ncbi:MAG: tRNA (adenosine(37)-N6)-threonylcarbamoyltransferase complex dimerization subunit type 1 TsaB [Deltaproteobacteria bacterium]|nr:tRNA (adenosine(37)-N6)-threonylcarbamoyltransferase complex dimerization subunit type 1 TsaB [Deltaproteobacteria bacterium]MDH4122033.1 tRNA (adenosine(37)-N6)-threonylcarbamoyltransferase complex dimerization subunit type 1 TsaB [Deltaproteobacteria bacterium]